jgi:hypothetical protein
MIAKPLRSKKKWKFFGLIVFAVLALCIFFRISRPRDIEAYFGMASECPPVWKQFAFRRFGKGDSATRFLKRFPPSNRAEFGRYGIYGYHEGGSNVIAFTELRVITRDGKLISAGAGSCTWEFIFFQTADAELDRQYSIFIKERHKKWELERVEKLGEELKKFYSLRFRWPTNEQEFSLFVQSPRNDSSNELGIMLKQRNEATIEIASSEYPDDSRLVQKPNDDTEDRGW